jgi:hypothetical protein
MIVWNGHRGGRYFLHAGRFFLFCPQGEQRPACAKAVTGDVSMIPAEFLNDPLDILISHL